MKWRIKITVTDEEGEIVREKYFSIEASQSEILEMIDGVKIFSNPPWIYSPRSFTDQTKRFFKAFCGLGGKTKAQK